jgi:tetratricopeptide (TPR) repeat protein
MRDNDNILIQLQNATTEKERDWIALQFSLENLKPELREAVEAASVPQWFDKKLLSALLEKDFNNTDFQDFIKLSFVETFSEFGYNIHERTRQIMLDKLWRRGALQVFSKRAAEYCATQNQKNTIWRTETIYHKLMAGEKESVDEFISQGIEWNNQFEYDKVETLIRPTLEAVKSGWINGTAAAWTYYRKGILDTIYSRNKEALEHLKKAISYAADENDIKANCIKALGDVHRMLAEYDDARACYEEARPIYHQIGARLGEANCIQALGDVHRMLAEYDDARACYEEARPIYHQIGARLGDSH